MSDGQENFPDGTGLSIEDIRAILAEKHEVAVGRDDPILMQVTILNAFLDRQEQLQKKHEKALGAFMSGQTEAYVDKVRASVDEFSSAMSGATAQGIRGAVAGFAADLSGFRTTLFLCTGIVAVSALINVAVFVLRAVQNG